MDRASALQRLGRQADARPARRADGRGRTARGARALLTDAEEKRAPAAIPTVRTFAPAFLADCAERWKPATKRAHADGMKRFVLPAFGDRRVDAVTAKDVRNWFDDLSVTGAGSANRALAVLSSMMKHAEALGLRREDSNPCKGLRRRKTGFKAHYLTDGEFAALGRALDGAEADHPVAVAALRFLLYTARAQVRSTSAQMGVHSRRPRGAAR